MRDYLVDNKIQLYCKSPEFQLLKTDLSDIDDNGSLLFSMWVNLAESEMRNKKARFKRSKERNARTGKFSGGFLKYGYDVDSNGYYVVNNEQAELIRYIFDRYEAGISIYKLTAELRQRGLINSSYFVQGILNSIQYTGQSNKYGLERNYPQIISIEQYNRCKAIAKDNNKRLEKTDNIYYAKNLIRCLNCGKQYIAMKASLSYLCYGKYGKEARINYSNQPRCNSTVTININHLDSLLWSICKEREIFNIKEINSESIANYEQQIAINQEIINNAKNQISKAEIQRKRNNTMYFDGQIEEIEYKQRAKKIDAQVKQHTDLITNSDNLIKNFEQKISTAKQKETLINLANNRADYLDTVDDKEKFEIIHQHIYYITLQNDSNTSKLVNIYYTSGESEQYRFLFKKMPKYFEKNTTHIYKGELPAVWQRFEIEYSERFTR